MKKFLRRKASRVFFTILSLLTLFFVSCNEESPIEQQAPEVLCLSEQVHKYRIQYIVKKNRMYKTKEGVSSWDCFLN